MENGLTRSREDGGSESRGVGRGNVGRQKEQKSDDLAEGEVKEGGREEGERRGGRRVEEGGRYMESGRIERGVKKVGT